MKPRHHIRLDDDLTERLESLCEKPGASKTAIISDALRAYLNRRAANEIDDLVKRRLDRLGGSLERLHRDMEIVMESQALFICHYLTNTAPLPEADKAAHALGAQRFQAFIDAVGRRIAGSKSLSEEIASARGQIEGVTS
jgi:predicted transcriptional regulator